MRKFLFALLTFGAFISHANELSDDDDDIIEKGMDISLPEMDTTGKNTSTLTNLEAEPSATIYNCVNVISGDFTESFDDYTVPGPESLPIQRVYSTGERAVGSLCYGWHLGKYGLLNRWKSENKAEGKGYRATIVGGGGSRMTYNEVDDQQYALNRKCIEKGLTNTSTGLLSGRTNPMNDKLASDKKNGLFTLNTGGGIVSSFERVKHKSYYYLQKESKPNGLELLYKYDADNRISSILSKNRIGSTLASVSYNHHGKTNIQVNANGAEKVHYGLVKVNGKYLLTNVTLPSGQKHYYNYRDVDKRHRSFLSKKWLPEGRTLEIDYFAKGSSDIPFGSVNITNESDLRLGRVKSLKAPVGHDQTPQYIYKFVYNIKTRVQNELQEFAGGDTCVYNVYNHLTRYYYSEDMRLSAVKKFTGEGPNYNLYSTEELFWKGPNLTNRIFLTKEGWPQFCKQYDYDKSGNMWRETLWGNLSGYNSRPICYPASGYPEYNGCEFEFKVFTYSNDGLNLMTSLTEGKTAKTTYVYKEGTDQLIAKFSGPIGSTTKREFFTYDANGTLVHHISDDGKSSKKDNLRGVTQRYIKAITPTTTTPVGLPETIEERYLDLSTGLERLRKRVVLAYTPEGKPSKKEVYDCNANFAYSEQWEYDRAGNVVRYEDPAGQVTVKKYDANNNHIYEQGPRCDYFKEYTYDYSNRLIKSEIVRNDGVRHIERNYYDLCSNKVAVEDFYGNRTQYSYDEFGRVTKTTYPLVPDEEGVGINPETNVVYNELGFPHITTDARGVSISRRFTIKGAPYAVAYPDGSMESFVYNVDGTVQRQIHKNGSYTEYAYDDQKRETGKEVYSPKGELLDAYYRKYSGFKLLEENTLGGSSTKYMYNYAGDLVEMRQGSARTTYVYDTLGRLTTTKTYFGNNEQDYVAKIQEFNCINQVVEEREEDACGTLLQKTRYEYDPDGHCIKTTNFTEAGAATTLAAYDPLGQLIESVDPAGNKTVIENFYNHVNDNGQVVAYQEVLDPLGNKTMTTKDALGRVVAVVKMDMLGNTKHKTHYYYDANGNKVRQVDRIYSISQAPHEVTTLSEYDTCNRLISTTEAAGTSEQKQTRIIYNLFGQKEHIVKADGVHLTHAYDLLGRLVSLNSSDNSVAQQYEYDLNSNAIEVKDFVAGRSTVRDYDHENRLNGETLGNGLRVDFAYDCMGRPIAIKLPDQTSVEYHYDATRLEKVKRLDSLGNTAYTHHYQKYAQGGLLMHEVYAGKVGEGGYNYDVMGRLLTYESQHLQETIGTYDKAGNMLGRILTDAVDQTVCKYRYDALSQLDRESGIIESKLGYDSWNNRLIRDSKPYKYNDANHLLRDEANHYSYDVNGNMVAKCAGGERTIFEYDALDRLVAVEKRNTRYRYVYDELNRRLEKITCSRDTDDGWVESDRVRYLYHGQNEVGMVDAAGVLKEYRTLGTGKGAEIGATVLIELTGTAYVPLHDHNGNVGCLVEAETGKLVETYRYTAFGEEFLYGDGGVEIESALNPWRFSSKRKDFETGFIYFGRRYYQPDLGRWVTPDPMGYVNGMNLYAYVLNNPITHYDLYGLFMSGNGISPFSQSSFTTFFQTGKEYLQKGLQLPGKTIEWLGQHLIPLPGIQDAVRAVGTILQGRCLCNFERWKDVRSVSGHLGLPELDPNNYTVMTNGMLTSKQDLLEIAGRVSAEMGGNNVHYVYNASHGFVADIIECGLQKLGFKTHSVNELASYCGKLASQMGEGGLINLYSHSQGGLMTSCLKGKLSNDVRQRMVVNTFGSPTQIGKRDFGTVRNFVSSRDLVPLLDPLGMLKGSVSKNTSTIILPSKHRGFDHSWNNETYLTAMMSQIKEQYGIDL